MNLSVRPPLDAEAVRAALAPPWRELRVVEQTRSTNADLLADAASTPSGTVLVAEHQTAGRGRLDRGWVAPPRAGLTFSALLRPPTPLASWGWLPLLTGVALLSAVVEVGGVPAGLKWPNDLQIGPDRRKAAGILVQSFGDGVVIGVGLNVTTTDAELDLPTAVSLAGAGSAETDRGRLLSAILQRLGSTYERWVATGGDAQRSGLAEEYRIRCSTIGQRVSVSGTDATTLVGVARGIDAAGRLQLMVGGEPRTVAAGDVVHLRPAQPPT